ncbi:MAG: intradiol ring-cleavage dioxygenase [Chthonomonadaceae bacterium]|nr:intradiol ring-cleavage dioxygenase [Chthonomonadaceae bacterium]
MSPFRPNSQPNPLLNPTLSPTLYLQDKPRFNRRSLLTRLASGVLICTSSGAFAEELSKTPTIEEGPYYPTKLPLDTDNDLIIVNDNLTPAIGEVTHLTGRILDAKGEPVRNAVVEIWLVDHKGAYLEMQTRERAAFDPNFQGFGRFLTGLSGEYYFRTIKPVRYPGRNAPHIHFAVKTKGREKWTTQLFVKGFPGNERDCIYRSIGDKKTLALVTKEFVPMKKSRVGELTANFDIVLGYTPEDTHV